MRKDNGENAVTGIQVKAVVFPLLAAFFAASLPTAFGSPMPGTAPDPEVLETQEKVDRLFERGDYERAIFIYREDLAPLGDKYAQYMIGYMYLTGKGVPQDIPRAAAWYRLAAERGDKRFSEAHAELLSLLNEDQKAESERVYQELFREYSDLGILMVKIEEDLEILRRYTLSNPNALRSYEQAFDQRRSVYVPVAAMLREHMKILEELLVAQSPADPKERARADELYLKANRELIEFNKTR